MKLLALLLSFVLTSVLSGAVDLTPTETSREQDGIVFSGLVFHQDGRKITYEPPTGWQYAGAGNQIKFTPPNLAQAQATIEFSPLPAPQNFDDATVKTLQDQAVRSVPNGSLNVAIAAEEKNGWAPNDHQSYEVTVSYEAYGHAFVASTLFLNLPDTQLRFRVVANKADFEKVHKLFRGSLYSWQWL
jgi:hypothetical protein